MDSRVKVKRDGGHALAEQAEKVGRERGRMEGKEQWSNNE
jgi:hypothetical protein